MAWDSKKEETFSALEKLLEQKTNTLGVTGSGVEEPFRKKTNVVLGETWRFDPTIGSTEEILQPFFDGYGTLGSIGTRHESLRLHSYLPSGVTGPNSCQTFVVVSAAPASHAIADIESVRLTDLISPVFAPGKSDAAEPDASLRGFGLALYPAACYGDVGSVLVPDLNKKIPTAADPGAEYGIGSDGWTVDYTNGIVRLSVPPLNGSTGVFNPNNVFGDIDGNRAEDAYGALTLFATHYTYSGSYGWTENQDFVTVGDGVISTGTYTGNSGNTIQSAIDSLPHGGTVWIKEGNYTCSSSVTVPINIKIVGTNSAHVVSPEALPAFDITGINTSITSLNIEPNSTPGSSCIRIYSGTDGYAFDNISITNNTFDCPLGSLGVQIDPDAYVSYKNIGIENNLFKFKGKTAGKLIASEPGGDIAVYDGSFDYLSESESSLSFTVIHSILHNGKIWIAVGANPGGVIYSSTNGISWTERLNSGGVIVDVAYGNGIWCATTTSSATYISSDGISWDTAGTTSIAVSTGIAFGGGIFCIVGSSGKIYTSDNGMTWTQRTGAVGSEIFRDIAHNGSDLWCAVGDDGAGTTIIQTSPNGIAWTTRTPDTSEILRAVNYGNGVWLAVGDGSAIQRSTAGTTWTDIVSGIQAIDYLDAVYDSRRGLFFIGGTDPELHASYDAETWFMFASTSNAEISVLSVEQLSDPVCISDTTEHYNEYYALINTRISENTFDFPDDITSTIDLDGYKSIVEHLDISNNIGNPTLSLTSPWMGITDGYMSNIHIKNNSFESVTVGNIYESYFSGNAVNGNVVISAARDSDISHNIVGGDLDPTLERSTLFSNKVGGDLKAEHIWNSSVSENIVGGAFTVGDTLTDGGTLVLDSKINSNTVTGAVSVATSYTDYLTAPIVVRSVFANNSAASFTVGSTSFDEAWPSFTQSVLSDNVFTSGLTIRGSTLTTSLSGNQVFGAVLLESAAHLNMTDGYVGTTCAIGSSITAGTAIIDSRICGNNFVGNVSLGVNLITGSGIEKTTFSENTLSGNLAVASAAVAGGGSVVDKTFITNNNIAGTFTLGGTGAGGSVDINLITNSTLTGNFVGGAVTFGSSSKNIPTDWAYYNSTISENVIVGAFSMYGKIVSSALRGNIVTGAFTCGPMAHAVLADGYCGSTFSIGNVLTSGTAIVDSDVINNQVVGAFTVGSSFTSGTVLNRSNFENNSTHGTLNMGALITSGDVCVDSSICNNKANDLNIGVDLTGTTVGTVLTSTTVNDNWIDRHFTFGDGSRDTSTETYTNSFIQGNIIGGNCTINGMMNDCNFINNSITGTFTKDSVSGTTNITGNIGTLDGYMSQDGDINISAGVNDIILHSQVIQNGPDGSSVRLNDGEVIISNQFATTNIKQLLLSLGISNCTPVSVPADVADQTPYYSVGFGGSISSRTDTFVAIGDSRASISDDGYSWINTIFTAAEDIKDVAYTNGTWCAVGYNGGASQAVIYTSTNGVSWTARTPDNNTTRWLYGVAGLGEQFVAVGARTNFATQEGTLQYSPDSGTTWLEENSSVITAKGLRSIAHDGYASGTGLWCAVGNSGKIITSSNVGDWVAQTPDGSYSGQFTSVAHDSVGLWCIVGGSGEIQTSPDGTVWTSRSPDGGFSGTFYGIAHDGIGMWCAVGSSREVQTSFDGIIWTRRVISTGLFNDDSTILYAVVSDKNGQWIIVGGQSGRGIILKSLRVPV